MKVISIGDCSGKLTSAVLVIALLLVSAGIASAEVIYVEPGDSIQAAINSSATGDTVIVKAGHYEENIIVNISGVTVTSEPENPDGVHIRARDQNSSVFQVKADNVTISGFNITGSGEVFSTFDATGFTNSFSYENSGEPGEAGGSESGQAYGPGSGEFFVSRWEEFDCPQAGVCLDQVENCTIERNNIFENRYGIYLQGSMNNTLSENTFSKNGIWVDESCSRNMVLNNNIDRGNIIIGAHCWDNTIFQNRLSNGGGIGIACCGGGNFVSKNEIINCSTGIDVYDTQARTVIHDNRITGCNYGVYLIFVFNSRVYNNTISNCSTGIFLRENCYDNELYNNIITFSNESGILLDDSADNRIYNNYFNNSVNVKIENNKGNNWNTTKTPGRNIVEGPYLGGNFWANPHGTGFSQVTEDSDSDGICDLPYNINEIGNNEINNSEIGNNESDSENINEIKSNEIKNNEIENNEINNGIEGETGNNETNNVSNVDFLPLAKPPSLPGREIIVIIEYPEANEISYVSIEFNRSSLIFGTLLLGRPAAYRF